MSITRYTLVQAIKTNDNQIIPIWDERLVYEKPEYGSRMFRFGNESYISLIEAVFDNKTKKLSLGIELDYFPTEKNIDHKVGDYVMQELKGRVLSRQKVVEIVYEEYELTIGKGSKLNKYWGDTFKMVNDEIYAIKQWKPFYILDNGDKIEWTHQLYKIQE